MSKTVGSILQVAAVVAAVAALTIITAGVATGLTFGALLTTSVAGISAGALLTASAVLGTAASLLGAGPSLPKPETTQTAIKTPRPPRVSGYGRSRLFGACALFETAEDGTAVDVYAVHDGKIDGIEQHYLFDEKVTLTGSQVNEGDDGRYRDNAVNLYTTDGSTPGTAFAAIVALVPTAWTINHRGDGVVMMALTAKAVKAKHFQEAYPQSTVPIPSIAARWQLCPDPTADDPTDETGWTWTENPVRHLLHYKIVREQVNYWVKIAPAIDSWIAAAADCDLLMPLKGVLTTLSADADDGYTSIDVGSVAGLANGMTIAITQEGDDSHTETHTVSGIAGTTISFSGGLAYDHTSGSAVSWASDADNPATEARYRACVVHKHTDAHKDVIGAILATFDGWIAPRPDGALTLYSGRYYEPIVSIGPDQIVAYNWEGVGIDDDKATNELICSYVSAAHDYNSVEADAWRDETDIDARGQVLSQPFDLQVPSNAQVRRLAKRKMARLMSLNRGTVTTNVAGRAIRGERFINLTIEEAGAVFYDGPVEIISLTRNMASGGVTFTWIAVDPNIDAWNPATEEGSPAEVGDRIASTALTAPTITSATPAVDSSSTGASVTLVIDAPDRPDLTWFARWKLTAGTDWNEQGYSDIDPGASVTLLIGAVPAGESIDVEAAYQVGDGRTSPWSDPETVSATITTGPTSAIPMDPLPAAPASPVDGVLAVSDGTVDGTFGASGAGLYRYDGGTSAWVFVG